MDENSEKDADEASPVTYHKEIPYIKGALDTRTLMEQLAEEAAELGQAALKYIRAEGHSNNYTPTSACDAAMNLEEEMMDVAMVYYLIYGNLPTIDKVQKCDKLRRWAERLGMKEEK